MKYCEDCGYLIEKCLNLPFGKKCCPDCKCHLIDKGIKELDESNEQLNNIPDDEKLPFDRLGVILSNPECPRCGDRLDENVPNEYGYLCETCNYPYDEEE